MASMSALEKDVAMQRMEEAKSQKAGGDVVRRRTITMQHFLATRRLDKAAEDLLLQYDKDGNGSFSKDEVAAIIVDLRDAMTHNEQLTSNNKMFKRLLIGSILFSVFLLIGMFCLSYVVAVLTANTKVEPSGVMMTKDGSFTIATDSVATTFEVTKTNGIHCIPGEQAKLIKQQVFSGRNVLLKVEEGVDVTNNATSSVSSSVNQLRAAGAQFNDDGSVCFWNQENNDFVCLVPVRSDCSIVHDPAERRKLDSCTPTNTGGPSQRRRLACEDEPPVWLCRTKPC